MLTKIKQIRNYKNIVKNKEKRKKNKKILHKKLSEIIQFYNKIVAANFIMVHV